MSEWRRMLVGVLVILALTGFGILVAVGIAHLAGTQIETQAGTCLRR